MLSCHVNLKRELYLESIISKCLMLVQANGQPFVSGSN